MAAPPPPQLRLPVRTLLSGMIAVTTAYLLFQAMPTAHPTLALAARLSAEHWYTVALDAEQVGYFYTQSGFTPTGSWRYQSRTHVMMQPNQPIRVEKSLEFSGQPPYALTRAHHLVQQGASITEQVELGMEAEQLVATLTDGRRESLGWHYLLEEYLGIERWLEEPSTQAGARQRLDVLDLSRLEKKSRTYALNQRTPIVLQHEAPVGPTRITLEDDLSIRHIRANDLFEFTQATMEEALQPANPAYKSAYKIPLDGELEQLDRLRELHIEITGADVRLTGLRGHSSAGEVAPRHDLPIRSELMFALLEEALDERDPAQQQLHDLVRYVHHKLEYLNDASPVNLTAALERGYGECTEFADLFTALALTHGWPTRTVIGLAFDPQPPKGFGLHAWNEVLVEGAWHSVDPTWNQLVTDASHMPMTDRQLAELRFVQGGQSLTAHIRQAVLAD